jgi:hypothetical protein
LDGMGLPRHVRPKRRPLRRGDPSSCGDHRLEFKSDLRHWECASCRLIANTAASRRSLAQKACRGDVSARIPVSHRLRYSSGVLWCEVCGSYTSRLPRALARDCPGAPPSQSAANVLRRLMQGLRPTTAPYLAARAPPRHAAGDDEAALLPSMSVVARVRTPGGAGGASDFVGVYTRLPRRPVAAVRDPQADPPSRRLQGRPSLPHVGRSAVAPPGAAAVVDITIADPPSGGQPRPRSMARRVEEDAAYSVRGPGAVLQPPLNSALCRPAAGAAWTRRVHIAATRGSTACSVCRQLTRTSCRGCSLGLCMGCAKQRAHCPAVGDEASESV